MKRQQKHLPMRPLSLSALRRPLAAGLLLALILPPLNGCFPQEGLIDGIWFRSAELPTGYYWVEPEAAGLALYRMPAERGDPGEWFSYSAPAPDWFTGPALYQFDETGAWTRISEAEDQTLDDWLALWDAAATR